MNAAQREAVAIAFGMALKEARQVAGLSQEGLAEHAHADRT
jgi:ribosome-binding protein aMBF1 (putative translation factor)